MACGGRCLFSVNKPHEASQREEAARKLADGGGGGAGLFAVDKWSCGKSKVFFLTHMHADHIKGLSRHWCRGPIYCSAVTAALLSLKFPALDIRVLPLSTPSLIPLPSSDLLEVTAIDADHCPGSVMFIFRGAFGCILHTGDFRWESGSPKLEVIKQCIASAICDSPVDLVHLDNTFCNPSFSFPTRHAAAQRVVEIITNHKDFDALIGVDMLGKEELLIFVAKALNTKIWVWPERMQIMKVLGITEFFTTDTSATKIRAVPRYSISKETLSMLNEITPTVAVLPSGLNYKGNTSMSSSARVNASFFEREVRVDSCYSKTYGVWSRGARTEKEDGEVKQICEKEIFSIPYSLHSCFSELEEFLRFIKPLSVKGNLSSSHVSVYPLLKKLSIDEKKSKHSTVKPSPPINGQYLYIVDRNTAPLQRGTFLCERLRAGMGLRKEIYKRSQRSWALLRARRAGGTFLCSQT